MDPIIIEIYRAVLKKDAKMYMSKNEYVLFFTWVEETKGGFRRSGAGEPGRIKKLGVEMKKNKGTLRKYRVL